MLDYKELQQRAKELELPYVGVSEDDLRKSIEEAEKADSTPPSQDPPKEEVKESQSNKKEQDKKQAKKSENLPTEKKEQDKKPEGNTAVVMNGTREVRQYTFEVHGKKFPELANQYAETRGFSVVFKEVKPGVSCPNCGHVIYPESN